MRTLFNEMPMKINVLLYAALSLFLFQACNHQPKHPQAEITAGEGATGMTDKSILLFSASVDRNINHFKKEFSLVYSSGDLSMYAEKYSQHGDGMLYKMFSSNGTLTETVKSYYFKNDSLILVKEQTKLVNALGQLLKNQRSFLRNNIAFKIETRKASSEQALRTLPYLLVQPTAQKYPIENYMEEVKSMNDAIKGTDKFDMVFQQINTYPDFWEILLKSKNPGNFTASVHVKNKDLFIDSLLDMPSLFKEEKLNLRWNIADREAIYVPVADTVTSASGLKR